MNRKAGPGLACAVPSSNRSVDARVTATEPRFARSLNPLLQQNRHKAVVDPPKGWVEDEAWTKRYQAMVMFPGGDHSNTKPIMYVRAHYGDKNQDLDEYVRVAQERWQTKVTDSTIEPLADFTLEGKPSFKVYLYKNPSQEDQAFELTAFLKDVDVKHPEQTYFFQIVLSSPSMEEVEKAKPAFFDILKRL